MVDDWWGRTRVLAACVAGLGGALVFVWYFALERVGGWGFALLAFALFCCALGVGTLFVVWRKEPPARGMDDLSARAEKVALELRHELGRILELATVKQAGIERGQGAAHERGFRFPDTQWTKYREMLTESPAYYDAVSRAYSEVDRVNANIVWLEGQRGPVVTLGLGPDHDLPRLIGEVEAAIDASNEVLERRSPAVQAVATSKEQPVGKTGLSDAEIEGLEKRYWAIKAEEKHQELSALLESGLDLRAHIEELQIDPRFSATVALFAVSPWPQKVQTWLKDAQLYVRKEGVRADFSLVRLYRTPPEALEAIDATLQALGTIDDEART
jgi:hypothetical protein